MLFDLVLVNMNKKCIETVAASLQMVLGHYVIEGNMNNVMYQAISEKSLISSAKKLNLGRRWTFQQYNNPKSTAKSNSRLAFQR